MGVVRALVAGIAMFWVTGNAHAEVGDMAETLGFESSATWQMVEGTGGLTSVPALSEGASALQIGGTDWRRIRSSALAFEDVDSSLTVDIALSGDAAGWETVGVVIEVPSAGVYWADLGSHSLAGLLSGQVRSAEFALPLAVREALQTGSSAFINITLNGGQQVTLDRLSLVQEVPEPPASTPQQCQNSDLEVADIHADFRDIWAGREDVATGKRTSQFPEISLEFNRVVDATRLSARLVGFTGAGDGSSNCIDADGNPVAPDRLHQVRLFGGVTGDAWRVALTDSGMHAPLDFNIVAFENIDGLPDVGGAIAAGGDINLQSFSVNQNSQQPLGVVVGGTFSATNGTVHGDIAHGSAPPQLQSVDVTGVQTTELPLDFTLLREGLVALSSALDKHSGVGSVSLANSHLTLAGEEPDLNVFDVDAGLLSQATGLTVSAPSGSSALVNLRGSVVSGGNLQVTLVGIERGGLLWNLPNAGELTLQNMTFPGSVLAPNAVAHLNNGNLEGTLVARSVIGSMEFYDYPLTTWEAFGGGSLGNTFTVRPQGRLRAGCEYTLIIDPFPANAQGDCLATSFAQSFLIEDGVKSPFDREVDRRRFQRAPNVPAYFRARTGVNTLVTEVFDRYAETLRLRPGIDSLRVLGPAVPSRILPEFQMSTVRQYYKGIPVEGFGYLVHQEDDIFRFAVGTILPDINVSIEAVISAEEAVDAAVVEVNPLVRPWETDPDIDPPSSELILRSLGGTSQAADLTLVWRVGFTGIPEAAYADVTADTGTVLVVQPRTARITECTGFDPDVAQFTGEEEVPVTVPFNQAVSLDFSDHTIGLWEQGALEFEAFNTQDQFPLRARFAALNPDNPFDPLVTEYVCRGSDEQTRQVASLHWAIQNAAFMFDDNFGWTGIDGQGQRQLLASVVEVDPDVAEDARPIRTQFLIEKNELIVQDLQLFPGNVAHEYAHGVLHHTRLAPLEERAESGALGEAYGDIMGALAIHAAAPDDSVDPWCMTLYGDACNRNLANPKQSLEALPDTWLGEHWKQEETCRGDNDYCWIHDHSTVVSHWFYNLVNGRSAELVNDNGCASSVTPVGPSFDEALTAAGRVVFDSFAALEPTADFLAARRLTTMVARELIGPNEALSIEKSWHAVGVGEGATPLDYAPADGETDVEPWSTTFRFTVHDEVGPWVLRYSSDPEFQSSSVVQVDDTVEIDGLNYAQAVVTLDAGTKYYWQAREGGEAAEVEGWDTCSTFTASFTTSDKPIHLRVPTQQARDGYYETNNMGQVGWEPVAAASGYQALLSVGNDGCDRPSGDWTAIPLNLFRILYPELFLGQTVDQNLVLDRDPVYLMPGTEIDPDITYHLFVRAMKDGRRGTCNHFEVRKIKLLPFEQLSPLHFETLPFESGGPLVWTPSDGAQSYKVRVTRFVLDEGTETVLTDTVDAEDVVLNDDGYIEHRIDRSATTLRGQMTWSVAAIHASGDTRSGWNPGVPSYTTRANFWNGAERITEGITDMGEHGPPEGDITPVTLVFPTDQEERDTQTCFKVPGNTAGMLWWFGPAGEEADPDEIQDAQVDPDATDEYSLCTDRLELTEDVMVLAVAPYSHIAQDTPVGFGPQDLFVMQTMSCGGVGDQCCEMGDECVSGAVCLDEVCEECGGEGQPCCDGGACDPSAPICDDDGLCVPCGETNQVCCEGGTCDRISACHPETNLCRPCGFENMLCCEGRTCRGSNTSCEVELGLDICKKEVPRCNSTVDEDGGNAAETHDIEMGQTAGRSTLWVNSKTVPDRFRVTYEGTELIYTTCLGTNSLPSSCDTVRGQQVCCDGAGWCSISFAYGPGRDTHITVEVEPNCAGTDDTEWEFRVECPQ